MSLTEQEQKNIINRLQGYIIVTNHDDPLLEDMDYDNAITIEELELFYHQALLESLGYCYLIDYPTEEIYENGETITRMNQQFQEAVSLWCSGLIWRKYDIRINDNIDESVTIGYGDSLIISAKQLLNPFKNIQFSTW
ncbi:hypothetical protein [Methanobrevibacter olleyae]|uniref:Uncharacterized protein n=1 Tax=Methanobrevibacter olleyae TaxID=294671 RepID=A0A126R2W1_METOL|nr:hypothetical protein [Methanobrevibacter olleyae]AMK16319.1 hypothetical protein YLM1_1764 [Methanobrevibacter olleyae]